MKSDWIWMPHAGHLIIARKCQFHLNTYVNGYIVSTVGEYWPDAEVRRIFIRSRMRWPKIMLDENGKLADCKILSEAEAEKLLALQGDYFDHAYLQLFGYEEIGLDRLYETMVFKAVPCKENTCCLWRMESGDDQDFAAYDTPEEAYQGHLAMCEKWDKYNDLVK